MYQKKLDGFSLIEIAIALVIVGVVIGGVLKGRELIESAKIKAVISQVSEIRLATQTFYDRYGYLPGDFPKAQSMIDQSLRDGDGSGNLTGNGLQAGSGENHKAVSFWRHLEKSGLYAAGGKPTQEGNLRIGKGIPKAKLGGGFTVVYQPFDDMPGHWLRLGEENGANNDKGGLTPLQAYMMDQQSDTGDPTNGRFRAKPGIGMGGDKCLKGDAYNIADTEKSCVAYFQLSD